MKFTLNQWNIIHDLLTKEQKNLEDTTHAMRDRCHEEAKDYSDWAVYNWDKYPELQQLEFRLSEVEHMIEKLDCDEI